MNTMLRTTKIAGGNEGTITLNRQDVDKEPEAI